MPLHFRVMNRRCFLLSLLPVFAPNAVGAAPAPFPRISPVPGGVARVALGASGRPPRAGLGGQRVLVMRDGGEWIALVGIPLATAPGPSADRRGGSGRRSRAARLQGRI